MSLKIALLASGRGSNVKAILDAIEHQQLNISVEFILSNVFGAGVLEIAHAANIANHCVPHKGMTREAHESAMISALAPYHFDYLVLAGYMRLMTPAFLKHFNAGDHYRVLNIHPSLLPAFAGAHAYEKAFQYGVKVSGITIHFVDEQMDHGPILLQETFPRLDHDTLETFQARGLALEHQLYPKALRMLVESKVSFRYDAETKRSYVEVIPNVLC